MTREFNRRLVGRSALFLTDARQPGEPHHASQLQNVFFPGHRLVLLSKFPRQRLATADVLRADEVASHFDGI